MTVLPPCPPSPNCVCSQAADPVHRIEPLRFSGDPQAAWQRLRRAVAAMPRTRITAERDGYLSAETHTRLLRFTDDLEFLLSPAEHCIHLRSASRIGYSDLGANRRRIEQLRRRFAAT